MDVVNKIWSLGSNAISLVKNAATAALNAVKDGLQFIANAVLETIVQGVVNVFQNLMKSLVLILKEFDNSGSITTTTNGISIAGISVEVVRDGLGIKFLFDNFQLEITNIFLLSDIKAETLSISPNDVLKIQGSVGLSHIMMSLGILTASATNGIAGYSLATIIYLAGLSIMTYNMKKIQLLLTDINEPKDDRIGLRDAMSLYFIGEFLGVWIGYITEKLVGQAQNYLKDANCVECRSAAGEASSQPVVTPDKSVGFKSYAHKLLHIDNFAFQLITFVLNSYITSKAMSLVDLGFLKNTATQTPYIDSMLFGVFTGGFDFLMGVALTPSDWWDSVQRIFDLFNSFIYLIIVAWLQSFNI